MSLRDADLAACRNLLRSGSKSFFAASLTLPKRVRTPATVVYAFCRVLDDAVDGEGVSPEVVGELRGRLLSAYAGKPFDTPIDRAFSAVVRDASIPRTIFDALLEGFVWDVEGRRYGTFEALLDYAVRVAGTVGVCMAFLMDRRERVVLARACDLGIAMQLTNIARDVGDDARRGRIYIPLEWLEEAGVDVDAWMGRPSATSGIREATARLLAAAETYYRRADPGILALPFDCRPAIRAARYIYSAIGDEVERAAFDSVSRRAVVSTRRKAELLFRSLRRSRSEERALHQTTTRSADFLLDAMGTR